MKGSQSFDAVETVEGLLRVVRFTLNVERERVPGTAWMLADLDEPSPLVLIQHPLAASHQDYFVAEVAAGWAQRGWVCAGIDAPLHGDRTVYDPFRLVAEPAAFPIIVRQFATEVSAVVDILLDRYPVDPTRLGYVGYSLGAMLGVGSVALDGRFAAAALCLAGEGGLAGPARGEGSLVAGLAGTAVRIVARTRDEVIPRDATQALFDALPGERDIVWLPGSHFDIGPDVVDAAFRWLKRHLDAEGELRRGR